ncbi:MAG: UMP kinase [Candidatus Micrarchaeota archaeon]
MVDVVISLGGSLLNPNEPDTNYIKEIAGLLLKMGKRYKLAVVTGGGNAARVYARAVRRAGGNEFLADESAIIATRQNALLLIAALGKDAYQTVIKNFDQAAVASTTNKIIVMGGTIPGFTTDSDAVLLAEKMGARRVVNLSMIDGIYDSNPKRNRNAKKYAHLTFEKLVELASRYDKRKAGEHFVFDLFACKIIARSKIETHFVHGRRLGDVERAIKGEKHSGTMVKG